MHAFEPLQPAALEPFAHSSSVVHPIIGLVVETSARDGERAGLQDDAVTRRYRCKKYLISLLSTTYSKYLYMAYRCSENVLSM